MDSFIFSVSQFREEEKTGNEACTAFFSERRDCVTLCLTHWNTKGGNVKDTLGAGNFLWDSQCPIVKNCTAETWGAESKRVIQGKWMGLTPLPITAGGKGERKNEGAVKGRKEGGVDWEAVWEEWERRGLESMNLCLIRLQEALRREYTANRTR